MYCIVFFLYGHGGYFGWNCKVYATSVSGPYWHGSILIRRLKSQFQKIPRTILNTKHQTPNTKFVGMNLIPSCGSCLWLVLVVLHTAVLAASTQYSQWGTPHQSGFAFVFVILCKLFVNGICICVFSFYIVQPVGNPASECICNCISICICLCICICIYICLCICICICTCNFICSFYIVQPVGNPASEWVQLDQLSPDTDYQLIIR